MKRDEQIKSEALKKAREVYMCDLCSWKQDCEFMGGQNTPYDCTECAGDDFRRGFEAGAKWADENPKQGLVNLSQVWHDAKEEPEKDRWVISKDKYGKIAVFKWDNQTHSWNGFAAIFELIIWAYADDLIPKGGEQ